MRLLRATVFALIAIFPGIIIALFAYLLLGGSAESSEWETWMYGPCYGIPAAFVVVAFFLGLRDESEV
ncbi:MAG: hypothetical protein VX204_02900 [Candidatus Thermoplasmatota archaeon]|nr:hypothetical protein [Candidatus Thermoplasmatota archaeon]MEE3270043.1 hypothetical protein [Candidatus Thermoplasmatota archaeon]